MVKTLLIIGAIVLAILVSLPFGFRALVDLVNTSTISADNEDVAAALAKEFRIGMPPGYKGAFAMEVGFFGIQGANLVALIPEGADPRSIFEGGRSISFSPGPHTILLAARSKAKQSETAAYRDMQRVVFGDGESGPPMTKVFVESAGRRIAAYEGRADALGQQTLNYFFFLGDGRMIYLSGPADGFDHSVKTSLASLLVQAYPANRYLYEHVEALTRDPHHPCGLGELPERLQIHAVGVRRGDRLLEGLALDPHNDKAGEQRVAVGRTDVPVVLVLMSGEPTVWNILTTDDARIAGVLASGNGRQRVIGLPAGVPLQELDPQQRNGCPPFYAHEDEGHAFDRAEDRIFELFAQGISRMHTVHGSAYFRIGELTAEPTTKGELRVEDVVLDPSKVLLPGKLGLAQLMQRGVLEPARPSDLAPWLASLRRQRSFDAERYSERLAIEFKREKVYLVTAATDLPGGMFGANGAIFLVKRGVPDPGGQRGHNTLIFADGRCVGMCP